MNILNVLYVMVVSAVPLIEQRGAIPMGIIGFKLNPALVFFASFIGSFLPVPFILLLFNTIFEWMKKIKFLNGFYNFVERKIYKNKDKIEKYEEIGLIAFVAIPLPTTGLWTGSAVAAFLKLDFKKSMGCIALGGLISAIIITVISMIFPALIGYKG